MPRQPGLNPPICASSRTWDDRHKPCAQSLTEMGPHEHFCLGLPWTSVFPISTSQVVRIIGLNSQKAVPCFVCLFVS
jgi:hypothetical protein